jgi:UDP-glucose 4-epimerase
MPLVSRTANGEAEFLRIFGTDYPTEDGTAVRDYVHVMDLAEGHVAALRAVHKGDALQVFNLGTGRGTSVLEFIDAFESANDVKVPVVLAERRPGDVAAVYAAATKAERELKWRATRSLSQMCVDSWRFVKRNS